MACSAGSMGDDILGGIPVKRKSRLSDAVWTAFTETIRFIIVPLVLVDLVLSNYHQLSTPFTPNITTLIVFFGILIVSASTLEVANKPGSYRRMLFGLSALAFVCFWIFVLFGGGIAAFEYGPYHISFDMTKIVYIIILGLSLKGLLVVSTFTTNRSAFQEHEKKRLEQESGSRAAEKRTRTAARSYSTPSMAAMSKVAYEVTGDEDVGYSKVPAAEKVVPPPSQNVKVCPVCGAHANPKDYMCKACGAWFYDDLLKGVRRDSGIE